MMDGTRLDVVQGCKTAGDRILDESTTQRAEATPTAAPLIILAKASSKTTQLTGVPGESIGIFAFTMKHSYGIIAFSSTSRYYDHMRYPIFHQPLFHLPTYRELPLYPL
jgi:hypothetical protein